jgi:ORF6N domain
MAQEPHDHELATIPVEHIEQKIYLIRGHKVMLDADLAALYQVPTRTLNQAVRRNRDRFPDDFMFQLSPEEAAALRSQVVTLEKGRGRYSKYAPYAFTEHGVVMLSSVLRSKRAVQMNTLIVRAFVKLREMLASHRELVRAIEDIRRKQEKHGEQIAAIIETIHQLLAPEPVEPARRIGFNAGDENESRPAQNGGRVTGSKWLDGAEGWRCGQEAMIVL